MEAIDFWERRHAVASANAFDARNGLRRSQFFEFPTGLEIPTDANSVQTGIE